MMIFYVCFLIGAIYFLIVASFRQISTPLIWVLKPLLQLRVILSLFVLYTMLVKGGLNNIGSINWYIIFFTSGIVACAFCMYFFRAEVINNFRLTHSKLLNVRINWLRYSLGSVYLGTAIFKGKYFNDYDSQFMRESGFSDTFIYMIIVVETLAGIGMCFKKTSTYSALVLIMVMIGATSTHYYNYFFRHIPDPFENSSMAIALLPLLLLVVFDKDENVKLR